MTTIEKVKNIFQLLEQSDVTELYWEKDDLRLDIRRSVAQPSDGEKGGGEDSLRVENPQKSSGRVISAPMVGTFYTTHPQSKQVYAAPGLRINVGQVVGVIEAMKVYREIFSHVDGIIKSILVADGQPVMYAQELIELHEI